MSKINLLESLLSLQDKKKDTDRMKYLIMLTVIRHKRLTITYLYVCKCKERLMTNNIRTYTCEHVNAETEL